MLILVPSSPKNLSSDNLKLQQLKTMTWWVKCIHDETPLQLTKNEIKQNKQKQKTPIKTKHQKIPTKEQQQ